MTWFALYRLADGVLVAVESDDALQQAAAELTAAGLGRKPISGPLLHTEQWNTATLAKEARPGPVNSADKQRAIALLQTASGTWTNVDKDDAMKLIFKGLNSLLNL